MNAGKQSRVWGERFGMERGWWKPFSVMDKLLGRKFLVQQNPSQQNTVELHSEKNRKGGLYNYFEKVNIRRLILFSAKH